MSDEDSKAGFMCLQKRIRVSRSAGPETIRATTCRMSFCQDRCGTVVAKISPRTGEVDPSTRNVIAQTGAELMAAGHRGISSEPAERDKRVDLEQAIGSNPANEAHDCPPDCRADESIVC